MPAQREKVGVEMLIQPRLDPRAASEAMKEAKAIQRKLSAMKVDWRDLSRHSASNLRNIRDVATAASSMAKDLSSAARMSFKELAALGKELEAAKRKAEELKKRYAAAKTPKEKEAAAAGMEEAGKRVLDLNKQILEHRKSSRQYGTELKQVIKAQKDYQDTLKKAASYTGKNFSKDFMGAIGRARTGGIRGAIGGTAQAAGAGARFAQGVAARGAMAAAGGQLGMVSTALTGLSKSVPILAAAVTALTGLWQLIKAASEHQTKLNKALLEGTGTANDFTSATDEYQRTIDDLRVAARDSAGDFLKFGANSEQVLGIINRYAVESTGSLMKTRTTLAEMGKGDVQAGMTRLAKSAIAYGKALGMEASDVASTMGQMQSEMGYGAGQIQDLMSNVVKSAATANMPMTKFMSIFRSVLPDVELYQNRLEELTGTIKLLSKAMSPRDVQRFMDAFSKGFQGVDFRQRLKVALVAGTGFVSKTLSKDFDLKAKTMAQNFEKYAAPGEDITAQFDAAYKRGTKGMGEFISKMQARAAAQGEQIAGTTIGEAMKLARYEGARRQGGPLAMATAMKGGGAFATYKILEKFSQTFVKGFDGLSEHVIKQLGVTEEQYEAMRSMNETMTYYQSQLAMFGKTNSKSMNQALRSLIAQEKGIDESQVTAEMMAKASQEQIFYAAEKSNTDRKTAFTAEDMAVQQVEATTSIGDKLENVIAFLLEKIYGLLEPILRLLDNVWGWLVGGKEEKEMMQQLDKFSKSIESSGYGAVEKGKMKELSGVIAQGIGAGATGERLAGMAAGAFDPKQLQENALAISRSVGRLAEARGTGAIKASEIQEAFYQALKEGKVDEAFKNLAAIPGGIETNLMQFGQDILPKAMSDAERERIKAGKPMRRPGADVRATFKTKAEYDKYMAAKAEAEDIEREMVPLGGKKAPLAVAKGAPPAKAAEKIGEKIAEQASPGGLPGTAPEKKAVSEKALAEKSQEQSDAIVSSQESATEEQVKATEDVYDQVHDTFNLLKKGIRYETSFLRGPWTNALKSATLESFRDALIEFAVIQAKMQTSEGYMKLLADYGQEVAGAAPGAGVRALLEIGTDVTDPNLALEEFRKKVKDYEGSMQVGGPVPDTGMYKLHRGEFVVPALPAGDGGGAGGRTTVNASVVINGTGLSPKQLEGAVYGALDRLARRP